MTPDDDAIEEFAARLGARLEKYVGAKNTPSLRQAIADEIALLLRCYAPTWCPACGADRHATPRVVTVENGDTDQIRVEVSCDECRDEPGQV